MKKILITGICGSIGSELAKQLYKKNTLYGLDQNETGINDLYVDYKVVGRVGDIRDYDTVNDVFSDFKPDIVYHVAALKHVEPMEVTPMEAINTNCIGTYNILHCAKRYEVKKLVFISSDKSVNSYSVMGATKRLGEIMTINQGYTVVRFGNVLNSRGSLYPIWERAAEANKNILVTDERMERYFISLPEAVELVIQAGNKKEKGAIYILDMGERKKIIDLAYDFIKETGKDLVVEIIGIRRGETLIEELMTIEEQKKAKKEDNFFIIRR